MIYCIKIAPYDLQPQNKDRYDYLRAVGLQQIDPPSLRPGSILPATPLVFCSPLKRAVESVSQSSKSEVQFLPALTEVIFDLDDLCGRQEYDLNQSVAVRRGFRESFIRDELHMPRVVIFTELKEVLNQVIQARVDVTIISHSFRLKILQAYIQTQGRLEQDPRLLNKYIFDNEKTFDFGQGFIISDLELSVIKPFLDTI